MATGSILLPIPGVLPDGSSNNAAPLIQRTKSSYASSASLPNTHLNQALYDAATNQHMFWIFRLPADFSSSPVLKVHWGANATSGNVVWEGRVGAITPADADTPNEHSLAAANSTTTAVNATEARRNIETSITLTNADSMAAGDLLMVLLKRDAANASDTCAQNAEVSAVTFEYTTV